MLVKSRGERIGEDRQRAASLSLDEPGGGFEQSAPDACPDGGWLDEQQRQIEFPWSLPRLYYGDTQQFAALAFRDEHAAFQ
jgi:hypothetical protein